MLKSDGFQRLFNGFSVVLPRFFGSSELLLEGMVYNGVRAALTPYEAGLEVKPAIIAEEDLERLVRLVKGCGSEKRTSYDSAMGFCRLMRGPSRASRVMDVKG